MIFASVVRLSTSAAHPVPCNLHFSFPVFTNFVELGTTARKFVGVSKRLQAPCMRMSSTAAQKEKITAPYGSWESPISADFVSGSSKRLSGTAVDTQGRLFWLESRPSDAGRVVLVRGTEKPGQPEDMIPKEFSVRTTVQEYGGGALCISGNTAYFSNYKDQRLYKHNLDSEAAPTPVTPDYGGPVVSFSDGVVDARFNRYITVMEDFRLSRTNSTTTIAAVDLNSNDIAEPQVLISGNDFYAFPRLDPKGERLAWIEWGHPNMPWDRSELWVGYISESGKICNRVCVAGNDPAHAESPTEPVWSNKGELFFVSDKQNGYWNLCKWIDSSNQVEEINPLDAEFSRPLWVFGYKSYAMIQNKEGNDFIICSYRKNGRSHLGVLDLVNQSLSSIDIPFTDIENITPGKGFIYVEGASAVLPSSLAKIKLDFDNGFRVTNFEIVWSSSPDCLNLTSYFSLPELIEFETAIPGKTAYAYFYPPSNPSYEAEKDEKPPLLLKSHGGPTAETRGVLNLNIQFWTSRGWAMVDVNYGGSTGYGREYRERLLRKWGIVDVNDCCSCAKYLVDCGKVDGKRLCITGGSAGGFTTLAALAFTDTFKAGASLYGVADLQLLRKESHKFESHYIDNLVGTEKDYFDRSPINFVGRFSCPLILFQGLEDKVVPPNQSRKIYEALKKKGLPVALVEYEGEQHGFRKAENIKFTLEQQMLFFARLVGNFDVADQISPIKVDNFD